ncbi:MAG: hypothetical protein DYG96_16165, partial [Chlorobi bacterium CHB2]|nr:hypothetical protein [Chlorobi bacterium CHB2]
MDLPIKVAGDVGEAKGEADFWSKDERLGLVQRQFVVGTDHPRHAQPGVGKFAANGVPDAGVLAILADEGCGRRGDELLLLGELLRHKNPNFWTKPYGQGHILD